MYQFSPQSIEFQNGLTAFMEQYIYANETTYAEQLHAAENRFDYLPIMDELKSRAREAGLWNLFVAPDHAEFCDHEGLGNFVYIAVFTYSADERL